MNRVLRIVLTLMLGALAAASAEAASRSWTQLGLPGGPVRTVAVATNGRTVYANTLAGVFKSVDGGRSWFRSSEGLRGRIIALRSVPGHPATLFAATTEGVFASFDAAGTWQKRSRGLPSGLPFRDLEVCAASPSFLYVLASTPVDLRIRYLVYRSTDAGMSWSLTSEGLPPPARDPFTWIGDLAVHPVRRDVAWVATLRGLFRTENGGKRWVRSSLDDRDVSQVAFDRLQPDRIYAVGSRVFVSTNGGRTWAVRERDFYSNGGLRVLAPDPTRAGASYALTNSGLLFKTTDSAVTWNEIGGQLATYPQIEDLVPDPTRSGVLYLTRFAYDPRAVSVSKSSNGGEAWRPAEAGIQTPVVEALAVDPATEDVYASLFVGGLWRWTASKGGWTPVGFEGRSVWALALDPKAPGTLYAVSSPGTAVLRSQDAGAHWEQLGDLQGATALTVVDGVLWAASFSTYRWDSAASSWEAAGCDGSYVIAGVGSGSSATLWCDNLRDIETTGTDLLFYSKDGGATWSSDGITVPGHAMSIAIDPQDPDRVFVARMHDSMYPGTGGLSYTNDGGKTWKHLSFAGKPDFLSVAIDPHDPQHIVAATPDNVFESLDGGATWRDASNGLLAGASLLVFDPQNPGRLYAGSDGGVFVLSPAED